jgi:hypothetical protein
VLRYHCWFVAHAGQKLSIQGKNNVSLATRTKEKVHLEWFLEAITWNGTGVNISKNGISQTLGADFRMQPRGIFL